jgi:menaquinone-dependent protoporphyrinogen oxidase
MSKLACREFLKITGIGLGGSVAACSGLTAVATHTPPITFPETKYGDEKMSNKVLVAYASKYGSTAGVAQKIGEVISSQNLSVEVKPIQDVTSLEGYKAVVLGSAVRYGQWLGDASRFVKEHQDVLHRLPVAIFSVHMQNLGEDPEEVKARESYTAPIHALLTPGREAFFSGKVDVSNLSLLDKVVFKAVKGKEGDLRNWDAISTWAGSLPADLGVAG